MLAVVFNYDGTVTLKHVTAARNVVGTDVPANNPGVATGGAIYNYDAPGGATPSVSISNSILSNSTYTNATGVEAFNNGAGTIQAVGASNSSLVTSSTGLTGIVLTADPQLSLLESLSGRILIRPFAGSPVVDAADPANTLPTDASGNVRPQGAGPDIGAAEGVFDSTVTLTAGTLVVSDTNGDAIFAVDPINGNRMLVSKFNVRGTGPEIALPRGIALDSSNNIYVANTSPVVAIIKIDPVTGNRTTVSSSTAGVGTGPNFFTPSGIAIRSDGKLIVSDTGGTNGNAGADAIFIVDPATGNRTILSDDVTPNTTNALTSASALLIHSTLGILVSDNALTDAITKIDGTTGAKTVFSSSTVPNGTNPLNTPAGLAEDTDQSILLVEQGNRQLLRLNPSTGERTLITAFPSTDTFEGVAVGTSGIFVTKTGPNPDQIFRVNPSTGALTLAAGNSIGDGVFFGTPNPTTGVITIGFNLGIAVVKASASVAQRSVFYNNSGSVFGSGSGNPINAIDPTKTALLPGQTVTTNANYTNYSRGLNGLIVDIASPSNLAGISPASFQFATWSSFPDSTPNFLTINPTVTVSTFAGGGLNGSDRVKIEFPNNAIQNAWLRVTMLADANTGLAANDVFYFGNARFDVTPVPTFPTQVTVNAFDVNVLRSRQGQNPGVISNIHDVDRNGVVNAFDTNFVRTGLGIASLRSFTAPLSLMMNVSVANIDSAFLDMSWQDEFRLVNNKSRQQKRG